MTTTLRGYLPDFKEKVFFAGEIRISQGKITSVIKLDQVADDLPYILPGLIDSHVHIESSMLVPSEFARLAVVHGTVATVSDPHEIANVCGLEGVYFMLKNGEEVPFKFYFGAPSCVPATPFETAGATLDTRDVTTLMANPAIKYLSEMMNFPGVLHQETSVLEKINIAIKNDKPIDGHAPGLTGEDAIKYITAGISTDHECYTEAEALFKLNHGMKIIIREGSAAKNFDALIHLLDTHPDQIMFCSDDKHPDSLVAGHINQLCARAAAKGIGIFNIIKAACINPVKHYQLEIGLLQIGDPADLIIVKDLIDFEVQQTYIDGILVAQNGITQIESVVVDRINQFNISHLKSSDLLIPASSFPQTVEVIEAIDGQLITNKGKINKNDLIDGEGKLVSNTELDILKIAVVNRYASAPVALAFIKNFGLKDGAIASSVAHDSHNIVAVGVDDQSLLAAINMVIEHQGGISYYAHSPHRDHPDTKLVLPLPVGGLMSDQDGYSIAYEYSKIDQAVKQAGSMLTSPFMTLSFMALLVIPHLKLSDLGLFDVDQFCLTSPLK